MCKDGATLGFRILMLERNMGNYLGGRRNDTWGLIRKNTWDTKATITNSDPDSMLIVPWKRRHWRSVTQVQSGSLIYGDDAGL